MEQLNSSAIRHGDQGRGSEKGLDHITFTLSVSPDLALGNLELFESEHIRNRFRRVADRINDINFTCHIEPFLHDAHGVPISKEQNDLHLRQMLGLQESTGITVTPVFNNIFVPNTYETLQRFLENLRPLVDMGIRSIIVPHVLWMKMGLIQQTFPTLTLKNTVLRRVGNAQEFWSHAEAGFDYVNIDRLLTRDMGELKQIRKAQHRFKEKYGKWVATSILHGEGCLGACPLIEEHYLHTISHKDIYKNPGENIKLFRVPMHYSCLAVGDPEFNFLMSVGLPYFREDLKEICRYFDVIKLAGRRSFHSLGDCLEAVEYFIEITRSEETFIPGAPEVLKKIWKDETTAPLAKRWRGKIKNCRFQCWDCNVCTEIIARLI